MPKTLSGRGSRSACFIAAAVLALGALGATGVCAKVIGKSHAAGPASFVGQVNLLAISRGGGGGPPPLGVNGARGKGGELRVVPLRRFRTFPTSSHITAEAMARTPKERPAILTAVIDTAGSFNGLDHYDQRILADNGNQLSLEPPDQALAVGNGFVFEVVNNAVQVYDKSGNALLAAPVSVHRFLNQVSEINRGYENQLGPEISDPRAYYDSSTGHFIFTEWATLNDASGNPLYISVQFVAVSATNDPTGNWYVYSYETTNSNTAGCPCLPDFNMLGVDANGVYISNNLFQIGGSEPFVGAVIYALPKAALESGGSVSVLQFPVLPNDFAIHPTVTPPNAASASEANGTEYAVEAEDDMTNDGTATSVNVWAISGTNTLAAATPALTLNSVSVPAQAVNAVLPPAPELDGPRPLGGPSGLNDPVPYLNPDDGRFSAMPYYLKGQIFAVASTAVQAAIQPKTGVATYILNVSGGAPALSASVFAQSVISAPGSRHLLYPAVAVNSLGQAAIGVTFTGLKYDPSPAVILTAAFGPPTINVVQAATLPDDGFTAYPQEGPFNGVGRWGDYGEGAVDDSNGTLYFGNEWIPPQDANHPRSTYANWGTYITHVQP